MQFKLGIFLANTANQPKLIADYFIVHLIKYWFAIIRTSEFLHDETIIYEQYRSGNHCPYPH